LVFLPPYSPELNPAEHLWEVLREERFANTVFADLDAIEATLTAGLRHPVTDGLRLDHFYMFERELV
jgi:transposase